MNLYVGNLDFDVSMKICAKHLPSMEPFTTAKVIMDRYSIHRAALVLWKCPTIRMLMRRSKR